MTRAWRQEERLVVLVASFVFTLKHLDGNVWRDGVEVPVRIVHPA